MQVYEDEGRVNKSRSVDWEMTFCSPDEVGQPSDSLAMKVRRDGGRNDEPAKTERRDPVTGNSNTLL